MGLPATKHNRVYRHSCRYTTLFLSFPYEPVKYHRRIPTTLHAYEHERRTPTRHPVYVGSHIRWHWKRKGEARCPPTVKFSSTRNHSCVSISILRSVARTYNRCSRNGNSILPRWRSRSFEHREHPRDTIRERMRIVRMISVLHAS